MLKESQAEAERLPPTAGALQQHILCAHYQCMIWRRDIVAVVERPDPTEYGWYRDSNKCITPRITHLPPASKAIVELIRCKCVKGRCRGQCSCKAGGMVCTQMCKCEGDPNACDDNDPGINEYPSSEESDDDSEEEKSPRRRNSNNRLAAVFDQWSGGIVEENCEIDNIVDFNLSAEEECSYMDQSNLE